MRIIKSRRLIGIVIGLLGSSCWAEGELVINQPLIVDLDNVYTNYYGGSLAILGPRVMMGGTNTFATGYASYAGGEGSLATNDYTFVWSDGMLFGSTLPYEFSAYASNGFRLLGGPIYGDGSGLTNLNLSTAVAGSITADKLAVGSVTASKLAMGSVESSSIAAGAVASVNLANGSIGTNKVVIAELNAWGNARYMSVAGSTDLVMYPGRTVAGYGMNLTNIAINAHGASQQGYNNAGTQTIGPWARGASQRGYNSGIQTIGYAAYGASQQGYLATKSFATNNGIGSVQLLNLSSNQVARMTGHASIGLGASTVTNDQAIVAGDGLASRGKGTVTARGFFGDGAGLTNLNLSGAVASNSITADKLAAGAVTAAALATNSIGTAALATGAVTSERLASNSVGTNKAVIAEWNSWGDERYLKTMTNAIQQALLNVGPFGDVSMGAFTTR